MVGVDSSGWLCVDIGTADTAAALGYGPHGEPKAVPLTDSGARLPSAVFVHSSTAMEVGAEALRRSRTPRDGVLIAPKQRIAHGDTSFEVGWSSVPLRSAVAALLRAAIARAQTVAQRPVTGIVLTHPQLWSPQQVQILSAAAADIGLPQHRIRTVPEPLAAVRFHQSGAPIPPGRRVAVVDFGSGSLDVAVLMAAADGSFPLLSARSDETLHLAAIDTAVRHWIADRLRDLDSDLAVPSAADPEADDPSFAETIRLARERLCATDSATLVISSGDEDEKLNLTRDRFDTLVHPFAVRAGDLVREALELAGVRARDDLHAMYLTGGGSRIPLIRDRLRSLGPITRDDEPETVTARGALRHPELGSAATPIGTLPPVTSRAPESGSLTGPLRRLPPLQVWQADSAGPDAAPPDAASPRLEEVMAERPAAPGIRRLLLPAGIVVVMVLIAGIAALLVTRPRPVTGTASAPATIAPAVPAIRATVPVGNGPSDVAVRHGSAYVLGADATVWIIDLRTRALRSVVPLGGNPTALVTDSRYLYVSADDRRGHGSVLVIDGATGAPQATIPVGPGARRLAIDPDRHMIYVTTSDDRNAELVAIDTETRTVTGRLRLEAGARDIAINTFTHTLYALPTPGGADRALRVIDTTTLTVSGTLPTPGGATGLTLNPNVHTVYLTPPTGSATEVTVVDTDSGAVTTTVPTGPPATRVALDTGNHTAYLAVTDQAAARLTVIDTVSEKVTATVPLDRPATAVTVDPTDHTVCVVADGVLWIVGS
ncbi:Hsp70 family protein [Nocardia aurantia]|uniref:Chaperone protein DnaK n=1 Tax=Nocardia aurantia TaxID=2585199 RepID=A0A7K0DHF3_9NOCA|nr:Hsp70 family protein [Nocardia aurantia]MQY24991.1 Chaperone protein DnaK [Nocardia aurantia]